MKLLYYFDYSCHYLGVVVDVILGGKSNTLCLSFRNFKMSLRVADYAISVCEWLDLEEESTIPKEKFTATKPKYVGWAVLGENESRKRGLFDVHDMPQTAGDKSKRSLRSTIKS